MGDPGRPQFGDRKGMATWIKKGWNTVEEYQDNGIDPRIFSSICGPPDQRYDPVCLGESPWKLTWKKELPAHWKYAENGQAKAGGEWLARLVLG
jgi:hypothetical protein